MEQEQVVAEWHGNQYRATVNHYGIAVIAANTQPVHVDDVELHRFDDDGRTALR